MALQIMKALLGSKNAKKGFILLRFPEAPPAHKSVIQGERKQVTVFFMDVAGFT